MILIAAHVLMWLGSFLDLASTRFAIANGAHERNPIIGDSLGRQVAVILGSGVFLSWLTHTCARSGFPGLAAGFLFIVAGVHGYLFVHNMIVAFTQIGRREAADRFP